MLECTFYVVLDNACIDDSEETIFFYRRHVFDLHSLYAGRQYLDTINRLNFLLFDV